MIILQKQKEEDTQKFQEMNESVKYVKTIDDEFPFKYFLRKNRPRPTIKRLALNIHNLFCKSLFFLQLILIGNH